MVKCDLFLMQDIPHPQYIEMVQLAEAAGCEHVWVIDGQDVFPDPWATAALLAVNTSRVRIGPGVTNPVTRHPRVTAGAMLTIHELSGGRGILGLGAGDNAVRTLGRQPARIAEVREAVDICRAKFRERKADIPIYVAANGPRLAAYACEAADGIIVPSIGTPRICGAPSLGSRSRRASPAGASATCRCSSTSASPSRTIGARPWTTRGAAWPGVCSTSCTTPSTFRPSSSICAPTSTRSRGVTTTRS